MKHFARVLAVVLPVLAAVATSALKTPTVTNYLEQHPVAAGYVLLVAGIAHAAWKAYRDKQTGADTPAPSSTSSSMEAK